MNEIDFLIRSEYYRYSSFGVTIYNFWIELIEVMDITIVDVLRFFLYLSVSLFLCTAVLLQGTLIEIGIVRCRRKLGRWNAILMNSCQRLMCWYIQPSST